MCRTPSFTARLAVRLWNADDLPLARLLWGDIRVTRYVAGPWTDEQIAQRLERYFGYQEQHGFTYWPWFLHGTHSRAGVSAREPHQCAGTEVCATEDALVGVCGLKPAPPDQHAPGERVLETGFYLRPEFHGQGYAAEMARAVISHAFGPLGCDALWAGCHPDNAASAGLLARLGFERHGTEFYEPIGMDQPAFLLRKPR